MRPPTDRNVFYFQRPGALPSHPPGYVFSWLCNNVIGDGVGSPPFSVAPCVGVDSIYGIHHGDGQRGRQRDRRDFAALGDGKGDPTR